MASMRTRRTVTLLLIAFFIAIGAFNVEIDPPQLPAEEQSISTQAVRKELANIPVKGRAPKTGYSRDQFGGDWGTSMGCDTRNRILARDLNKVKYSDICIVEAGVLNDPYTGKTIEFKRGSTTSGAVQIDHVVALSNAWQTGAQQLEYSRRVTFSNDPLNLLAVDGEANQQKLDGDAATWLPSHKLFRCQYVSRQVKVKAKYDLWVTVAEKDAIERILSRCQ